MTTNPPTNHPPHPWEPDCRHPTTDGTKIHYRPASTCRTCRHGKELTSWITGWAEWYNQHPNQQPPP